MIIEILKIRVKQISRILSQIGIFRAIFLFVLIAFILLLVISKFENKSFNEIVSGVFIISIFSLHLNRKDKVFINICALEPHYIFMVEYVILSIPLIFAYIYYELWIYLVVFLTIILFIPFLRINFKKSSINTLFQSIIPDKNFEWKSGIRKNLFLFIGIWFAGLLSSFIVASVPIVIFVLSVVVFSFYEKPEPVEILIADEINPRKFIFRKIQNHLLIFSLLIIPLILSFTIFNPEYYYIPIIEFILFSILLTYTILMKYAFYQPGIKSGATQIFTMFGVISIFIPVLFPLIVLLSIRFLFQAFKNLKFYLNDYN